LYSPIRSIIQRNLRTEYSGDTGAEAEVSGVEGKAGGQEDGQEAGEFQHATYGKNMCSQIVPLPALITNPHMATSPP